MFDWFKPKKEPKRRDWEAKVVWLPAGHPDNPFPEEVLDCRAVALGFYAATSEPKVVDSFSRLRTSDGRECCGRLPDKAIVAECELRFPFEGKHEDGPKYVARAMEDKWDFYAYDNRLYVRRSWTGYLTHVAELEFASDAVIVRRIHSEYNTVWGERDFAIAQLHFLITTHLLRSIIPFPIPPEFPRTGNQTIAVLGFNAYGRRAQFARFVRPADLAQR